MNKAADARLKIQDKKLIKIRFANTNFIRYHKKFASHVIHMQRAGRSGVRRCWLKTRIADKGSTGLLRNRLRWKETFPSRACKTTKPQNSFCVTPSFPLIGMILYLFVRKKTRMRIHLLGSRAESSNALIRVMMEDLSSGTFCNEINFANSALSTNGKKFLK